MGAFRTAVFVIADLENAGAAAPARASVVVQVEQADLCALVSMISGTGVTTEAVVDVDPNLGAARVVAVVPTFNGANGSVFNAVVDLTFTATSAIAADNGQEVSPDPPGDVTTFHRTFRAATATGSILGPTGELVPDASVEAEIQSIQVTFIDR